jgi:hypothetical protein
MPKIDPSRWLRIDTLLNEALALPPPEREGWLLALPAEHAPPEYTLARLLEVRISIESGDILHTLPKLDGAPAAVTEAPDMGARRGSDEEGPYCLIRELGEGGMGSA